MATRILGIKGARRAGVAATMKLSFVFLTAIAAANAYSTSYYRAVGKGEAAYYANNGKGEKCVIFIKTDQDGNVKRGADTNWEVLDQFV